MVVAQFRDRETDHGQSRDGPNPENARNMHTDFTPDMIILPDHDHIQSITNTASFKQQLKTFQFSAYSYY